MSWCEPFLSDIVVEVEDKEYKLHKSKLAVGPCSSGYFKSLFQFTPTTSRTKLDIPSGASTVWEAVLTFVYDHKVTTLGLDTVVFFSYFADYLRISALAQRVEAFLAFSWISAPTALRILVQALDPSTSNNHEDGQNCGRSFRAILSCQVY